MNCIDLQLEFICERVVLRSVLLRSRIVPTVRRRRLVIRSRRVVSLIWEVDTQRPTCTIALSLSHPFHVAISVAYRGRICCVRYYCISCFCRMLASFLIYFSPDYLNHGYRCLNSRMKPPTFLLYPLGAICLTLTLNVALANSRRIISLQ